MLAPRLRRSLARLALCAIGVLCAMVLFELGYRIHHFGAKGLSPRAMNSLHIFGKGNLLRAAEHPGLRYQLRPDLDTLYLFKRFRTNSIGLRERELPFAKPDGTYRIAVVGDSFAMGSGVEREETFGAQLEQLLSETPGDRRYECINFGVAGYGIGDYTATVRHLIGRYEPDMILVALTRTDRMPAGEGKGPFVPKPPTTDFFRPFALEAARASVQRALHRRRSQVADADADAEAEAEADADQVAPGDDIRGPLSEATLTYLRTQMARLREAALELGLPVVVVHVHGSRRPDGVESRLSQVYRAVCEELDLAYFDASAPFAGLDAKSFHVLPFDAHPNARGHRLLAGAIHAYLLERGLPGR